MKISNLLTYKKTFNEELQISYECYGDTLAITDLRNAQKTGRVGYTYILQNEKFGQHFCKTLNKLIDAYDNDLSTLLKDLESQPKDREFCGEFFVHNVLVRYEVKKGVRLWAPWVKLNPLKTAPKKWTVKHVLRALANSQASIRCTGKYTDDYAFDAANNFGEGRISATAIVEDILENPRGWWCSKQLDENNTLSLCCHSFNSNKVKVNL